MDDKYLKIKRILESAETRFCMITFTKKNGDERTMCVQYGVGKYRVKGNDACDTAKRATETRRAAHPNLLPVWDVDRQAFRSVNMDTVTRVKADGRTYTW